MHTSDGSFLFQFERVQLELPKLFVAKCSLVVSFAK